MCARVEVAGGRAVVRVRGEEEEEGKGRERENRNQETQEDTTRDEKQREGAWQGAVGMELEGSSTARSEGGPGTKGSECVHQCVCECMVRAQAPGRPPP